MKADGRSFVVDASVSAAWFLPDEATPETEAALQATATHDKVDREDVSIVVVDELAARHALSAYDAVYLELALRRGLPLATRGKALSAAMAVAGVLQR